jgi:hypothetical protein
VRPLAMLATVAMLLSLAMVPATGQIPAPVVPLPPPGTVASDNVTFLKSIPEPGVIGARFRDGIMYVTSLNGLTTWDVADPASPVNLGRLVLPHFENEDVDLGGNTLLISNDAAESRGVLFVVDISNPRAPRLASQLDMGGLAGFGGPGHTATCVAECRYAWVSDAGGIKVIDLINPAKPLDLGTAEVATGGVAVHDVQQDENGLYWIAGFDGTSAYRIPADYTGMDAKGDPSLGELVVRTNAAGKSRYLNTAGLDDGSTFNDFIHHNSLRRKNSDVVYITEEDYTRPQCKGAGSFQRWRLPLDKHGVPTGEDMTPIDKWSTEYAGESTPTSAMCSAHYFDEDKGLVAQAWYQQGVRFLDVKGEQIRQVGYFITPTNLAWAAYFPPTDKSGKVVYVLDATAGIHVLSIDRAKNAKKMPTVVAPVLPSFSHVPPGLSPDPTWGYACPLV